MFKQFKTARALALIAACAGSGYLFAPGPKGPTPVGGAVTTRPNATTGALAAPSVVTTSSSTVIESSIMAVKIRKIEGFVSAVTAQASESMGSGVGHAAAGAEAATTIAKSSGSNHRSSAWLRASFGAVDNATSGQQWNGQSYLTMIGADYKFNNMFCAGLGLSYSHLNARTEFNNGTTRQDTLGVNPYFIIVPHKNFNLEFIGGWSTTTGKDVRDWSTTITAADVAAAQNGGLAAGTAISNRYKSSPKSQALFGGVFANFVNKVNKASFSLQLGYLMMQSKMNKFTESSQSSLALYANRAAVQASNTYKAQSATAKILVGYQMTPSVMPFLDVHAQYDVKRNEGVSYTNTAGYKVSRSAFGGGAGFQVRNDDSLSGSLQFDYTAQGQLKTYVTGLRLHYAF